MILWQTIYCNKCAKHVSYIGSSCVQWTVFCDDVCSHLVPIWSAAGSPTAGGREQGSDLPGAGTVLADDRRRPGLAGRASLTKNANFCCARYCIVLFPHECIIDPVYMSQLATTEKFVQQTSAKNPITGSVYMSKAPRSTEYFDRGVSENFV